MFYSLHEVEDAALPQAVNLLFYTDYDIREIVQRLPLADIGRHLPTLLRSIDFYPANSARVVADFNAKLRQLGLRPPEGT